MNLRETVLHGGMYLVARHIAGLALGIFGAVVITRLIGPHNFGLYSGALVIIMFLGNVGRLGVDVYLVRHKEDPDPRMYDQAFSVVLVSGIFLALIAFLASPWLGRLIDPRFLPPLWALLPTIPFAMLVVPAQATLERNLDYRSISFLDLAGQTSYYIVAPTLAFLGFGYWAQVIGYWTWQVVFVVATYRVSGYRPHLVWSQSLLREMLGYGVGYSSTQWILQARNVVPTVVVGHYLGPTGVGYVALATQVAEMLAFVKNATWRVSIAALAKVQTDYARLRAAQEEAMLLQVLALGPLLGGFALVAPVAMPLVFGRQWDRALIIYPFIALGYLMAVVFNMHASILFVLRRNKEVALSYAVNVLLLFGVSLLLVPRLGLLGFGVGQVVALLGYVVVHVALARIMAFSYRRVLPWLIGCIPPLFAVYVPLYWEPTLWIPLVIVALWPGQRRQIAEYASYFWLKLRPASVR